MLRGIIRDVSRSLADCALTYLGRESINVEKAARQHRAYKEFLVEMGIEIINLPAEPDLPDSVFVEDTAVVLDEIAVIARMGLPKRREETATISSALAPHRPRRFINHDATLDGGDCIRIGRTLYVGNSTRTNEQGIAALRSILYDFDYQVETVKVKGCLHLSTGCSYLGNGTILANREWIATEAFKDFDIIDVPQTEPWAATALTIDSVTLIPSGFPETFERLDKHGFKVREIDISEFQKAEGGLSCLSLIFKK